VSIKWAKYYGPLDTDYKSYWSAEQTNNKKKNSRKTKLETDKYVEKWSRQSGSGPSVIQVATLETVY
jgi:hypothetical protein